MLWSQSGLVGAPPLEAITTSRSPSWVYATGLTRSCLLFAPVVWSRSNGLPAKLPPTLPPFARNSSMIFVFQLFVVLIYNSFGIQTCIVNEVLRLSTPYSFTYP